MIEQTNDLALGKADQNREDQQGSWDVVENADDLLGHFVALAGEGLTMPVTLTVGGSLVTGLLCSGKEYLEGVEASLRKAWPEFPDFLGAIFKDRANIYDANDMLVIGFVHLKDARIYNGGVNSIPTDSGVWWRGRIDAVTGWSFGKLQAAKN